MTFVCLWSPDWRTGGGPGAEVEAAALAASPRVVVEGRGVVWVDGRGVDGGRLAAGLVAGVGGGVRAGVAAIPVAAEAAARAGSGPVTVVEAGGERAFLAPLPLGVLSGEEKLLALLEGVGVVRCGELAALEREAVEVRFGGGGAALWRLARADDPRRIFGRPPRERPEATLDFVDYVLTDPARLVFAVNGVLGSVCGALRARGERARRLRLVLPLADGGRWERSLRAARPTAERDVWLRLARRVLERLTVPDAVAGVAVRVEATEPAGAVQGDLFDRGFATAGAVEAALARLVDAQGGSLLAEPGRTEHPLPERRWGEAGPRGRLRREREGGFPLPPRRSGDGADDEDGAGGSSARVPVDPRATWKLLSPSASLGAAGRGGGGAPALTLQLLPEPRPIAVETAPRQDHALPVRYREGREWVELATSAGPERISGGRWEESFAREYFRCVTRDGSLLWLFRDAREDRWYLHGWWD